MGRKRNRDARLMLNDAEMEILARRMAEAGQPSRARFLRKLALEGRVVSIDAAPVAELVFLIRNATNNINQLAKKANISGAVVSRDVAALRAEVAELKRNAEGALALLRAALTD